MAEMQTMWFMLNVIAFTTGIASFKIPVLSAASSTIIGALLSIAVAAQAFFQERCNTRERAEVIKKFK